MNAVNRPATDNHLDLIDQAIALYTYDVWRRAYDRGLVTAAELSRFLLLYDRETADLRAPAPTFLNPRRTGHE